MYQTQGNSGTSRRAQQTVNLADIALRGSAVLFNIQLDALRSIWQMQARSAAMLGAPDYSDLLRSADDGAKRLIASSTDQILSSARQVNEAVSEMQRQFALLLEQRGEELSEEVRQSIEELNQRAREGLEQVAHLVRQSAEEVRRAQNDEASNQAEQARPEGEREEKSARHRRAA